MCTIRFSYFCTSRRCRAYNTLPMSIYNSYNANGTLFPFARTLVWMSVSEYWIFRNLNINFDFESPKSFNICLSLWIQTEGPDQNIVGYKHLNLNRISLSFIFEKGRVTISRSFTKIVDATELKIITYERIIVKIRKK